MLTGPLTEHGYTDQAGYIAIAAEEINPTEINTENLNSYSYSPPLWVRDGNGSVPCHHSEPQPPFILWLSLLDPQNL